MLSTFLNLVKTACDSEIGVIIWKKLIGLGCVYIPHIPKVEVTE